MAFVRLTFIFLLQFIFLVNIQCDNNYRDNIDEFYRPQILCFVNYLNSDQNRLYYFNYGTLINAQNKDQDNTDLTIDVEVECRNPRVRCDESILECKGTVKYNTDTGNYEVLPGASCNPKTFYDITTPIENPDSISTENYGENIETTIAEEIIHSEAPTSLENLSDANKAEPVQEKQFVKQIALVGAPTDLNHDIEGLNVLTNTALKHIETERDYKPTLVKVVRVQRQIVAGVKYILLLEIAPTNCAKSKNIDFTTLCSIQPNTNSEYCEVTYYQRPWISNKKNIISNNCTTSQEFEQYDDLNSSAANDQDNEIDTNYDPKKPYGSQEQFEPSDIMPNYDVIADSGNADDILKIAGAAAIDPARLRDLESQIIVIASDEPSTEGNLRNDEAKPTLDEFLAMSRKKRGTKNNEDSSSSSSSSSDDDDDDDDDKNNNNNKDDDNNNDDEEDKDYEKTKRKNKKYNKKHNDDKNDDDDDSSSSSSSSSEEDDDKKTANKKKYYKYKKSKRSTDQNSSSSEETNDNNNNNPDKLKKEDKSNQEDNRTKRQTNSKKKKESSESNETSEEKDTTTPVPIKKSENIEKPVAKINNVDTSEEISSEESKGGVRKKRSLPNYLIKTSQDEKKFVKHLADYSISALDDIDSDNNKRVVLQILGSKKNPESTLYYLTLRVGISNCPEDGNFNNNHQYRSNEKKCKNKLIESQTKICHVQVKVDENKNPTVEKSQCKNIKKEQDDSNINRTNYLRNKRGIPGGVNSVDPQDEDMKKIAATVLQELSTKGLEAERTFVKIISASKQVVSGMLYRLKIETLENSETKICDLEIWDQPWLKENSKEVKIKCDEKAEKKTYRYRRSPQPELLGKDDHDVHIGLFKQFMHEFNKFYESKAEFKNRFKIFRENMKTIKLLNENEQGTAKYGPTFFADMTKDEYKRHLGLKPELRDSNNIPFPNAKIPDIPVPKEFDWRTKGVVSEVKNQGSCGSCWAFSVTGNIEGQNAIKTGKLIELSEQELVDCDKLDNGCNGGLPDNAYRAIEQLGGLETESDYPYEAEDEKCHFNKTLTRVQISGAVNISTDEADMVKWLVKNGPISIGINANAMQFYMGGVSHPWKFLCNPSNLDHGVLIVGYGVHKYPLFNKVLPYWIVKNSWGPSWGEQGYYRVFRGDGTCGVNQMASSAVL